MKKILGSIALALVGMSFLTACLRDDANGSGREFIVTTGVLVLNSGNSMTGIDGSLSYIDFATGEVTPDIFKRVNGTSLGGTPVDILVRGGKLYVTVSDDNAVLVLDKKTYRLIETISTTAQMGNEAGINPRHLSAYENKVYVSTYGGYVGVIDTLSLSVSSMYRVGSYPEGISIGVKDEVPSLYVANSDYGYGNGSISIINLASGNITEFKNANLHNPQELAVAGDVVYVLDGGYFDEYMIQREAGVYKIQGTGIQKIIYDATEMAGAGYNLITCNAPADPSAKITYSLYDTSYGTERSFFLSGDSTYPIISPCGISIDPNTGYIMIGSHPKSLDTGLPNESANGYVNLYASDGQFAKSYAVGVQPRDVAFLYEVQMVK